MSFNLLQINCMLKKHFYINRLFYKEEGFNYMTREDSIKRVGIVGITGNIFLLTIKFIIGFICHSQAMLADAANSAGDIFASFMTTIGNKIAKVPKDNDHNFGHGKAEYLFSMFISISMIFVAFKLLWDSANSLIFGSNFNFSIFLIVVCIITIIVKFSVFLYTRKLYKLHDSILIKSSMQDHKNDCIVTICTLVSIIFGLYGIYWVDGVVGIGISLWIFYSGSIIFLESYNVLMDTSVDETTKDMILELSHTYDNIKGIEEIASAPVGYKYIVFITICVDGNISTFQSHKLADDLENDIKKLDKIYDAIVHVNPV